MQQVTTGLSVWQIIILPLAIKSGKMNVDANALTCILMGEHNHHMEADSLCALISQVAQGTTLIEAYSCNIQVTETLDM